MVIEEILVKNRLGLHLRPATMFASIAQQFSSDITVGYKGKFVVGKSALSLLKLEIQEGERISIQISGEDEDEAMKTLIQLINRDLI